MRIGYLMQAGVVDVRSHPISGPGVHVSQVINELILRGNQVRLLAKFDKHIWVSDNLEHYDQVSMRWLGTKPIRLLESSIRRIQAELQLPYLGLFDSIRFVHACKQELADFDLFYERMGWVGYGGGIASRYLKTPLVLEVNGDHLSEMELQGNAPRGLQRELSSMLMKQAIHTATHIVATGDGWKQRLIERWRVAPDKITVIENGSDMVNLLTRSQLRSFLPEEITPEELTVIYVGAFEPWHGLNVLIKALAKVIELGHHIRLVLVGSGSQKTQIDQLIQDLGIKDYVEFTGHIREKEIAFYLAQADIGVSPYCGRVEFSGLKLLDYKAAGLAIIASGKNGQPTIINDNFNGLIVTPCDEQALSNALIKFLDNTQFRRQMGQQARIEAEQQHSWQHTVDQLEELFKRLILAGKQL